MTLAEELDEGSPECQALLALPGLARFPQGATLQQITRLVLSGQPLEAWPPAVCQLTALVDLDVSRSGLRSVSECARGWYSGGASTRGCVGKRV